MKRLIAVLSGLLVLPAFAEVAPIYYDDTIEYSDMEMGNADDASSKKMLRNKFHQNLFCPVVYQPPQHNGAHRITCGCGIGRTICGTDAYGNITRHNNTQRINRAHNR